MRLTTRTNLAMRTLMVCAVHKDEILRSAEIAQLSNSSPNHVAHVVKTLNAEGYLQALRGRTGGVRLARPAEQISVGAVFRLFEMDIPFAECFDADSNSCPLVASCRLRGYILRALDAFYHELDMVTLQDLVQGNCGLSELLSLHPAQGARCDGMPAAASH